MKTLSQMKLTGTILTGIAFTMVEKTLSFLLLKHKVLDTT